MTLNSRNICGLQICCFTGPRRATQTSDQRPINTRERAQAISRIHQALLLLTNKHNNVHLILVTVQLNVQNIFYNKFIIFIYMFRALLCSSSGGQNCTIQHLVSSHSVGGRPVHRLREDGHLQGVVIQNAV